MGPLTFSRDQILPSQKPWNTKTLISRNEKQAFLIHGGGVDGDVTPVPSM